MILKKKVIEIKLEFGTVYASKMVKIVAEIELSVMCQPKKNYGHAVNDAFEIWYWHLQITKATIFQNFQKVLDFQTKNSHQ